MTLSGTSTILAELAKNKINEIYEIVYAHQEQLTSFGFSRGFLGISVLNYLYSVDSGDKKYLNEARLTFDKACDMIDSDLNKSYPQDFAELGIVSQYLYEEGVTDMEPNTFLEDIDMILLKKMRFELDQKNIGGFVNGALGYGLYFLQRSYFNRDGIERIVAELIRGIVRNAVRTDQGCYWISRLHAHKPNTYLSMPHGSAAVALFLSRAVEMGLYSASQLQDIMQDTIAFIQAHRVHDRHYQYIDIVQDPHESRLALCYGDMGIGYMLLRAGSVFNRRDWYEEGMVLLKKCASRREDGITGVQDASILFGATGLALMFDRIARLTKDPLMKETSAFWYSQILRYDCSPDGYAGFKAANNQWHTHTNLAFGEGIIGIGCGLIKGLNPDKVDFNDLIWLL
ncbi:lanthionine synthetase LanC family protein [Dyadobacter flavalbus]|nr:lanthionine synthetase LanC family protein [Dyadobacter flavalbus]